MPTEALEVALLDHPRAPEQLTAKSALPDPATDELNVAIQPPRGLVDREPSH